MDKIKEKELISEADEENVLKVDEASANQGNLVETVSDGNSIDTSDNTSDGNDTSESANSKNNNSVDASDNASNEDNTDASVKDDTVNDGDDVEASSNAKDDKSTDSDSNSKSDGNKSDTDDDTDKTSASSKDDEIKAKTSGTSPVLVVLAVLAVLMGGAGLALGIISFQKVSTPLTMFSSGIDGNSANFTEGSVADVANKVSESVVSILTSTKAMNFFGQSVDSSAAGTGIIATSDGYIITNKHVINGAHKVTVVLDDGTKYEDVEVVATDPLNDVAFLKIKDASDLKAATLGDSKTLQVGQQVIAIGNALGEYQNSVTAGIISGTGRSVTASDSSGGNVETLSDMIQTDAAINSGNSGGPLVNAAGEVIGINTATSATAENMGFAIPISSVKGMLNQLIETGKASRAYLGVYSMEITPEAAKEYNLPVETGAYLYSPSSYSAVVKDSPASKAGLLNKDIVTAVNGVKVGPAGSLSDLVGEFKPGDTVQLTVIREGKEIAVNVTLEGYKK